MLVSAHKLSFLPLLLWLWLAAQPAAGQTKTPAWTLRQCLDTAQANNKNLKISQNNVAWSKQKHQEAKSNLLPKVNAFAEYKYFSDLPYQLMPQSVFGGPEGQFREAQFGVPHHLNANIQLTLPLYNRQVHGAIQAAEIASELTELQHQKTGQQVLFEVTNLYYNAQLLHHQLLFIDSNLASSGKLLATMELLRTHLLAKGTDVSKVKLQAAQLSTQKERISSQYGQVLHALKIAMGIKPDQHLEIVPDIAYDRPGDYAALPAIDIRMAHARQRLVSSELNTLKSSRLPTLSLFGSYGTTGFGYDKKPNDFLRFYPIGFAGLQAAYTLFDGSVAQRKVNQKKLELLNSELRLALLADQHAMQVENARQQRLVAEKAVDNTGKQVQLAQVVYDQTVLQHKQGTASLTEILQADNALREAQQTNLSALVDYLKADLELKHLTGNILIKQ